MVIGLIPEATNRKPVILTVVEPADTAIVIAQVAVPGECRTELRRTPPEADVANTAECPIAATVAARQACKATLVCSSCIRSSPYSGAGSLHLASGN